MQTVDFLQGVDSVLATPEESITDLFFYKKIKRLCSNFPDLQKESKKLAFGFWFRRISRGHSIEAKIHIHFEAAKKASTMQPSNQTRILIYTHFIYITSLIEKL